MTEIFYFSGAGNSLAVAHNITEKLGGKATSIAGLIDQETVRVDADTVGFAFPVHGFKCAPIMERFVGKIESLSGKYVFAIGTYGLLPNKTMRHFSKLIEARGGVLSAGFVVRMPNSGLGGTEKPRKREKILARWDAKLPPVCDCIADREKRKPETTNFLVHGILGGELLVKLPAMLHIFTMVLVHGWKSFGFTADARCDGCGICEKVCPVANIAMKDGKPVWGEHCALCFACLQWCPKESVQVGKATVGYERYHHPAVTLKDMIRSADTRQSE